MKRISFIVAFMCIALCLHARTLVAYYSYTGNIETIVSDNATAYTLTGQSAPDGYKGIVVQQGKKIIKR